MKIAYVTTWYPRQSGISSYTLHLAQALEKRFNLNWKVIAVNEDNQRYHYDDKVIFEIKQNNKNSYIKAAEMINKSDFDVVSLQHEFNIFGEDLGKMILEFLKKIKKPVITTLHSIPLHKTTRRRENKIEMIKKIEPFSAKLVTSVNFGNKVLTGKYFGFDPQKIWVIHHGSPEFKFIPKPLAQKKIGYPEKFIVSSYGLINDRKGYDDLIKAMIRIVKKKPEVVLLLWGKMHPGLNISYYKNLIDLVKKNNLQNNIFFKNKYLSIKEINLLLNATDVFATPIWNMGLGSSGTLTYAMVAGKCILATPFVHAKEDLADDRGIIVPVKRPDKIAEVILDLYSNQKKVIDYEDKMKEFGKKFIWNSVAKDYFEILKEVGENTL